MYVRVKETAKEYSYKSIVYAIIGTGGYRSYIVLDSILNSFVLVSYISEETKDYMNPQIQVINADEIDFITVEKTYLLKLNNFLKERKIKKIDSFMGFKQIFDNYEFLANILKDARIDKNAFELEIIELSDKNEWKYLDTQADADQFMKLFAGFHDARIDKILYEEDMQNRKLIMTADNSGWYGIVELCFEGLIAMNLRPPQENLSRELFSATLIIKDNMVFWADEKMIEEDMNYEFNFIKALNLKWKKIQ